MIAMRVAAAAVVPYPAKINPIAYARIFKAITHHGLPLSSLNALLMSASVR